MRIWFVYIVRCTDGSYYTGVTNDIERRIAEHNEGRDSSCYTYNKRPVLLMYRAEFREVLDAIAWEKQVKRWSRKKKEALINGDQEMLEKLANCRNLTHHRYHSVSSRAETRDVH